VANAHRFYVPVGVVSLVAPPAAPATGDTYFDTTLGRLQSWDGTRWVGASSDADLDARFVSVAGDVMTGELRVPDQVVAPPSTPATAVAIGYVDQVITVAAAPPDAVANVPVRDGLVWAVVGAAPTGPTGPGEPTGPIYAGTNWENRPANWLPNTVVLPGDQKIGMLVEGDPSLVSTVRFVVNTTGGGSYRVIWGDTSLPQTFGSGAVAFHQYRAGTDQVWCIIEPTAGDTLSSFGGSSDITDGMLEILFGPNTITEFAANLSLVNVRHIDFLDTVTVSTCSNMFATLNRLVAVTGQLDTSNVTDFSLMFTSCNNLMTIPYLDTSNGTNFDTMFANCSRLTEFPDLDTSNGTTFTETFARCYAALSIPDIDTSNGTNFSGTFQGCQVLTTIPALDVSQSTVCSYMFSSCFALTSIDAFGSTVSIDLMSCALDAAALNTFFTNLGTAAGAQTVDITGNPGAATCDRAIATAKGWTVTG
jgi:Mycoplasma protein of unknown function, DUF285